jgi:TolA-binding protein
MFRSFSVLILLAALASPPSAPAAASKEIQELQRDVALLQQMVKELQAAQDKKFADVLSSTQQAVESANRANTAIASIQSSLQQSLRTQEDKVVAPVVGLSTRMDTLTTELRATEQNLTDLSSQLTKILATLDDMKQAIKVIQAPPMAPPPADSGSASQPGASSTTTAPGGQTASADCGSLPGSSVDTYNNARHDYESGNTDFALTEFADYLKCFEKTPLASNAQYYIGMVHYVKGEFDTATKDFDLVLEKYPENANKNPESRYYKGMSLLKSHKPTEASTEFKELILRHPRTDLAAQACKQLESLGMHCPSPAPAATKKSSKKE